MTSSQTIRRQIADFLAEAPATLRDISQVHRISEKDAAAHLEHIRKSAGKSFKIVPAQCRKCGFVFESRRQIKKPSKCPECKGTWIEEPEYFIEAEDD